MESGSNSLEVLSEEECLGLLASNEVGRLAVVVDGQPLIFPVNYVLEDRYVLVHTDFGTKLSGGTFAHAAFEIDDFDPTARSGWSVLVQGMAHDITDAVDPTSEHLHTVQFSAWAPGTKPRLLRIEATTVAGRRFGGASSST